MSKKYLLVDTLNKLEVISECETFQEAHSEKSEIANNLIIKLQQLNATQIMTIDDYNNLVESINDIDGHEQLPYYLERNKYQNHKHKKYKNKYS